MPRVYATPAAAAIAAGPLDRGAAACDLYAANPSAALSAARRRCRCPRAVPCWRRCDAVAYSSLAAFSFLGCPPLRPTCYATPPRACRADCLLGFLSMHRRPSAPRAFSIGEADPAPLLLRFPFFLPLLFLAITSRPAVFSSRGVLAPFLPALLLPFSSRCGLPSCSLLLCSPFAATSVSRRYACALASAPELGGLAGFSFLPRVLSIPTPPRSRSCVAPFALSALSFRFSRLLLHSNSPLVAENCAPLPFCGSVARCHSVLLPSCYSLFIAGPPFTFLPVGQRLVRAPSLGRLFLCFGALGVPPSFGVLLSVGPCARSLTPGVADLCPLALSAPLFSPWNAPLVGGLLCLTGSAGWPKFFCHLFLHVFRGRCPVSPPFFLAAATLLLRSLRVSGRLGRGDVFLHPPSRWLSLHGSPVLTIRALVVRPLRCLPSRLL